MLLEHRLLVAFFDANRVVEAKPIFATTFDVGTAPVDGVILVLQFFRRLIHECLMHHVTQAINLVTCHDVRPPGLDVAAAWRKRGTFEDFAKDHFVYRLRQKTPHTAARANGFVDDVC